MVVDIWNGRCHLSERSLPFETVDAIYNGRLHTSLQRKLKETNWEKILTNIKTKKEKKTFIKEKLEEKKSPKISRLELGFLALTLNRVLFRVRAKNQGPVVQKPINANPRLKN